jgi:hypothetical protein
MHQGLGDTAHKEADKDIPNEMKHYFLLLTSDFPKITRSNIRTRGRELRKSFASFGRGRSWVVIPVTLGASRRRILPLLSQANDHRNAASSAVVRIAR